jgi:phosphoribosylaminoimidazole-succinocarboxamide synthase
MNVVTQTNLTEYPLVSRGKVRDIYEVDPDTLLIVTTDRISAYDVILPDPIPFKGAVLNQITLFWMEKFRDVCRNHVVAYRVEDFPKELRAHQDVLAGRSVLVRKAKPLPVECIVRGYITGSGWKDYLATGEICGHKLPAGLKESEMLPQPIFTPSTKAELGQHDENITTEAAAKLLGQEVFSQVQALTLSIYKTARDYARGKGIIIADTKFEFGLLDGKVVWIDEALTPDSSRFWPVEGYAPGQGQPSFDKQFVRDWLTSIGFNKKPPAPNIPAEIVAQTQAKYLEAYRLLTGRELAV